MSHASPAGNPADRNLLFGILAVQMDFVSRDALIAGMNAWVLAKHRPLGDVLVEQGALALERQALLDALADEHLKGHGGDVRHSLAAVADRPTLSELARSVSDSALDAMLAALPKQGGATIDSRPPAEGMRFETLRPHARGGLGLVSVARDTELGREVALKEMQEHVDDAGHRGRFVREAKVTGGLEHPGIVPVYGLGQYADGRPYYAMRFIRGETLQEAIRKLHAGEPGYTLRGLVTRFVAVCNAVGYAHSRGVIHRDLKPANVMLGPYGETLVVDWGLAKVVGRPDIAVSDRLPGEGTLQVGAGDVARTRAGSLLGTPEFMSPEQARGETETLTPATDIYGLGATLYALLSGRPPVRGDDVLQVLERIWQGTFVSPRQINPATPAPLEAICRKAMSLRPEDRYRSALELATDCEAWSADEPVSSYAEPWLVRARRWRRRHRIKVTVGVTAAVVALVLGGFALAREQQVQARRQQEQAQRRVLAEAALQRAGEAQAGSRWAEARAALQQAEDRLPDEGGAQLRPRLEAMRRDLDLVQRLDDIRLDRATRVQGGRFDNEAADRQYEAAFRSAGLADPQENEEEAAAQVADSPVKDALLEALDNWALVASGDRRARVLSVARRVDSDPGRARLRDPAAWADTQLLARVTREVSADAVTPGLATAVGGRLAGVGEGEELLRTAQRRLPGDFWLNYSLAHVLEVKRRPAEAEAFARAALAVRPDSSPAYSGFSVLLERQGKLQEAELAARQAVVLDPRSGPAHANLGFYLYRQRKVPEAESILRRAIELDPTNAMAYSNLGRLLNAQRKPDEAMTLLRRAIEINPKSAIVHNDLGWVLDRQGKLDEAAEFYRKAIALDPEYAWAQTNLGWVLDRQRNTKEAERLYRSAIALDPVNSWAYHNLGWLLDRQGNLDEAAGLYRKAMQLDPQNAWAPNNLGWLLERQGKLDDAVPLYQKSIAINPGQAEAQSNLARTLLALGKYAEAAEAARRALPLFPKTNPERLAAEGYLRRAESAGRSPDGHPIDNRAASAAETLARAERSRARKRFAEAACFAAEAFASDSKTSDDLEACHRYKAACSAVLASAGQGEDPPSGSVSEKADWRLPALSWLRADLAMWKGRVIFSSSTRERQEAIDHLRHWLVDPDLSSVRESASLAELPEPERKQWQKLWETVHGLVEESPGAK
jgi:eukaryotic-like serine/threonine-protein kinase